MNSSPLVIRFSSLHQTVSGLFAGLVVRQELVFHPFLFMVKFVTSNLCAVTHLYHEEGGHFGLVYCCFTVLFSCLLIDD